MSAFSHQTLSEQKAKWRPEFPFQQGVSCHGEIEAFPRLQEQSGSDWFPQAWSSRIRAALPPVTGCGLQRRQAGLCLLGLNSCLPGRNSAFSQHFRFLFTSSGGRRKNVEMTWHPRHRCWASLLLPPEQDSFTANE